MDKNIIKVEECEIEKLIPYEHNAKIHTPEQINAIVESIKAFGFAQPILADPGGVVVVGHGRLQAAKQIGLTHVPVWYLQNYSESELQALRIADNKLNSDTGFDFEKLQFAIEQISADSADLLQKLNLNFDFSTMFSQTRDADADTTKQKLETYLNNTVKQIVLVFEAPVYDKVIERLDKIRVAQEHLTNNTDVFLSLLEFYEQNKK